MGNEDQVQQAIEIAFQMLGVRDVDAAEAAIKLASTLLTIEATREQLQRTAP